ncbi:hypothetical protein NBRC116188_11780 [Oceaniserpentilla sp. 4NH20-0058]|uniref:CPBP family intramembrane glutamic endopeptidase n=1 Tax=Oceaniserpentilla sp. 4NH20-0058 TaxID=3127660 RepID=UPI003101CEEF
MKLAESKPDTVSTLKTSVQSDTYTVVQREQDRTLYLRFYIMTVWCFFITGLIPDYTQEPIEIQTAIRWLFLFLLVVPTALSIRNLGFTWAEIGLTTKNTSHAIIESLFIFALLISVLLLAKMLAHEPLAAFFHWGDLERYSSSQLWFYCVSYLPHTIGQEFVARGVGLAYACRILNDYTSLKPVIIVSIIFAAFHVHLSLSIALAIFISSLLFGMVYRRHGTLIGVCLLHFLLGISATALGLI